MTDPALQFQEAGADSPEVACTVGADLTAAAQSFAALAQALADFGDALCRALAPVIDAIYEGIREIAAWASRHWRAIRAALGPSYRPETMMRKKLRRYLARLRN